MDKKINKQRKNETTIKRRYGIKNIVLTMFLGLGIIPLFIFTIIVNSFSLLLFMFINKD